MSQERRHSLVPRGTLSKLWEERHEEVFSCGTKPAQRHDDGHGRRRGDHGKNEKKGKRETGKEGKGKGKAGRTVATSGRACKRGVRLGSSTSTGMRGITYRNITTIITGTATTTMTMSPSTAPTHGTHGPWTTAKSPCMLTTCHPTCETLSYHTLRQTFLETEQMFSSTAIACLNHSQ